MQTIKITQQGELVILKILRGMFKPSDKIVWFAEGNTLILKKINPSRPSEIARRSKEKPMSMQEINKEIFAYRREKKHK